MSSPSTSSASISSSSTSNSSATACATRPPSRPPATTPRSTTTSTPSTPSTPATSTTTSASDALPGGDDDPDQRSALDELLGGIDRRGPARLYTLATDGLATLIGTATRDTAADTLEKALDRAASTGEECMARFDDQAGTLYFRPPSPPPGQKSDSAPADEAEADKRTDDHEQPYFTGSATTASTPDPLPVELPTTICATPDATSTGDLHEAERAVLAGIMLDCPEETFFDEGAVAVLDRLRLDDFTGHAERIVFRALRDHRDRGLDLDPFAVGETIKTRGELPDADFRAVWDSSRNLGAVGSALRVIHTRRLRRDMAHAAKELERATASPCPDAIVRLVAERLQASLSGSEVETISGCRAWQPVDLAPLLDGTSETILPAVGARADGTPILYPGRVHWISGETESGKSWFALHIARHELNRGNSVCYIDFEDGAAYLVGRLIAMGTPAEAIRERFAYISPAGRLDERGNLKDLGDVLDKMKPTLAILDGLQDAMALHGLDPKDGSDVAQFVRQVPRWISDKGPAVACLDHVTKNKETRGRSPIGSVHKINGLNGAAYYLENRVPFAIGSTGRSEVMVTKDRLGQLRRYGVSARDQMHRFGELVIASHDEQHADVELVAPISRDDNFRPTILMRRISDTLESMGPLAQRQILEWTKGSNEKLKDALRHMIVDGYVSKETPHRLLKPYREPSE